jgi:hypothetical protein
MWQEIQIPEDYAKRIDKMISSGIITCANREEFLKMAVQMKLKQIKVEKLLGL